VPRSKIITPWLDDVLVDIGSKFVALQSDAEITVEALVSLARQIEQVAERIDNCVPYVNDPESSSHIVTLGEQWDFLALNPARNALTYV
jgi:hypothetical protein